ncbi:MAG: hypothetical protein SFT90_07995 [Rickettsiales bacterium]|nr:hypothetical protein [Rickettsiales bacterium]
MNLPSNKISVFWQYSSSITAEAGESQGDFKTFDKVFHNNKLYYRINPDDIDFTKMTEVQKSAEILAFKVTEGRVKVVTKIGFSNQTINYAEAGDYIVYNIGTENNSLTLLEKLLSASKKVIKAENFDKLYSNSTEKIKLSKQEQNVIKADLASDNNDDNSDFTDYTFIDSIEKHIYIGKPVFVCKVPYNFVIRAPWGSDQFVQAGGMIVYNINTSRGSHKDIYGVHGSSKGVAGEFEKSYSVVDDEKKGLIVDTYKMALRCDRSPIAGIQFTNRDMRMAHERIGKDCPRLGIFVD